MSQNPNSSEFFATKMTESPSVEKKEKRGSLVSLFSQAQKSAVTPNAGVQPDSEEEFGEILSQDSEQEKKSLHVSGGSSETSISNCIGETLKNSAQKNVKSESFFANFMAMKTDTSVPETKRDHPPLDSQVSEKDSVSASVMNSGAISCVTSMVKEHDSCPPKHAAMKSSVTLYTDSVGNTASDCQNVSSTMESSKMKTRSFFDSYMAKKDKKEKAISRYNSAPTSSNVSEDECSNLSIDLPQTDGRLEVTKSKIDSETVAEETLKEATVRPGSTRTLAPIALSTDESSNDSVYSAYSVDEIDMGVFDSLPWDIQVEIREFNKRKNLEEKKQNKGLNKFFKKSSKNNSVVKIYKGKTVYSENQSRKRECSVTDAGASVAEMGKVGVESHADSVTFEETVSGSQVIEMSASGVNRKYETVGFESLCGQNKKHSVPLVVIDDESPNGPPVTVDSKCPKCGQVIPAWERQEHDDYHFALDLQNQTQVPSGPARVMNNCGPMKRKTSGSGHSRSKKAKKVTGGGALDKFFKS
jgi:hypothetical protein